jgi:alkaline phosphatase D
MQKILIFLCLVFTFACKVPEAKLQLKRDTLLDTTVRLNRITFGSCNKSTEPQDIWAAVIENDPDLWIWLGDNIYADTYDMSAMAANYDQQLAHPEYQSLLNHNPVIGIWDDHDYGVNDGGKEYPKKDESKRLLLDFLGVPQEAAVRKRKGAYQSYTIGPKNNQVKIILLDTRYFRDLLQPNLLSKQRYKPNLEGDILGEAQWEWLEKELTDSQAEMHIIASSIQVLPEEHYWEKWANFPASRNRLFDLLVKTKPKYPLIVSGDRHIAELSKIRLEGMDYPIYELTASGLTHTWSSPGEEPNQHRIGDLIIHRNFALLEIDWMKNVPHLRVSVRGETDQVYLVEQLEY